MNKLKILLAATLLMIVNVYAIGQKKNGNQIFSNNLHFDLLSAELLGLYYSSSNELVLSKIDNKFLQAPLLKNFDRSESKNKLKFETLLKDHKYYKRQSNKNLEALNLLDNGTSRIEFHDSFWKSNMKMQYKNNYSSIGNWEFKLGPSY